jgi:uncharacterized protein DUF6116
MLPKVLATYLGTLRFPKLFGLLSILFLVDLFIPDPIPFADELFLALMTALVSAFRTDRAVTDDVIDVEAEEVGGDE